MLVYQRVPFSPNSCRCRRCRHPRQCSSRLLLDRSRDRLPGSHTKIGSVMASHELLVPNQWFWAPFLTYFLMEHTSNLGFILIDIFQKNMKGDGDTIRIIHNQSVRLAQSVWLAAPHFGWPTPNWRAFSILFCSVCWNRETWNGSVQIGPWHMLVLQFRVLFHQPKLPSK